MFKKLKTATGFTNDELKIVASLVLLFVTGLVFRFAENKGSAAPPYDYSKLDHAFFASVEPGNSSALPEVDSLFNKKDEHQKSSKADKAQPGELININTADAAALQRLPGVGEKTALQIIEYREKEGAFKSPEDIMNVKGIGVKKFEKMKPFIIVKDKK